MRNLYFLPKCLFDFIFLILAVHKILQWYITIVTSLRDRLLIGHSILSLSLERPCSTMPHRVFYSYYRQNANLAGLVSFLWNCTNPPLLSLPLPLFSSLSLSLSPLTICVECSLEAMDCIKFSHITVSFPSPWQSEAEALSVFFRWEILPSSHLLWVLIFPLKLRPCCTRAADSSVSAYRTSVHLLHRIALLLSPFKNAATRVRRASWKSVFPKCPFCSLQHPGGLILQQIAHFPWCSSPVPLPFAPCTGSLPVPSPFDIVLLFQQTMGYFHSINNKCFSKNVLEIFFFKRKTPVSLKC